MKFRIIDIKIGFFRKFVLLLLVLALLPFLIIFGTLVGLICVWQEVKLIVKECWEGTPKTIARM